MKIINRTTQRTVLEEAKPVSYGKGETRLSLQEQPDEYFYGGGVQNGRFSHKGKSISFLLVNSRIWLHVVHLQAR